MILLIPGKLPWPKRSSLRRKTCGWQDTLRRKGPAEKVLQDIHAKALAIEDADGNRMVFVTLDLIGVPKEMRVDLENYAQENHGLKPAQLLINASHTHSGPMIRLYTPPKGGGKQRAPYANIPEEEQELRVKQTLDYRIELEDKIIDLIGKTLKNLQPAIISWSKARCGFAMNRRTPAPNGSWRNSPNPDAR